MQYKYVGVYQIRGLTHAPGSGDTEIYTFEGSTSVKAFLSYDIDAQCYELDRALAISYLMLKGLASKSWDDSKPEIEAEITRIRENRRKNLEDAEALVVVATGETEPQFSDSIKETDEFVLGFDVVRKDELFDTHRSQANAAVTAVCLATVHDIIQVKKLSKIHRLILFTPFARHIGVIEIFELHFYYPDRSVFYFLYDKWLLGSIFRRTSPVITLKTD